MKHPGIERDKIPSLFLKAIEKYECAGNPSFVPTGFAKVIPEPHLDNGEVVVCLFRRGELDGDNMHVLFEHLNEGSTVYLAFEHHPDGLRFQQTMTLAAHRQQESDPLTIH